METEASNKNPLGDETENVLVLEVIKGIQYPRVYGFLTAGLGSSRTDIMEDCKRPRSSRQLSRLRAF